MRDRGIGVHLDAKGFLGRVLPPSSSAPGPIRRLGIVASRRVGPAVVRNRAKRRFRELFRRHQEALPEACDVLIIVRSSICGMPFAQIREAYLKLCQRAKKKLSPPTDPTPDDPSHPPTA